MANFLSLPAELRLQTYSYLCTGTLHLNFCSLPIATLKYPDESLQRPSASLRFLKSRAEVARWARRHGLHLPAICSVIANEIIPILEDTVLEFHCHKCLDQLYAHFVQDLGLRGIIIQRLQCQLRLEHEFGIEAPRIPHDPYRRLNHGLENILATVGRYYGRYDLLHGDLDALHKQKWYLRKLIDFKKMPRGHEHEPEAEPESAWREHQLWDVTAGIKNIDPQTVMPSSSWMHTSARRVYKREEWWILAELDREDRAI